MAIFGRFLSCFGAPHVEHTRALSPACVFVPIRVELDEDPIPIVMHEHAFVPGLFVVFVIL